MSRLIGLLIFCFLAVATGINKSIAQKENALGFKPGEVIVGYWTED